MPSIRTLCSARLLRLDSLGKFIRANSFRKGVLGASRFWLAIFIARFVLRWLGRIFKKGEMPVVFSEKLALEETLVVRHLKPN